MAKRAKLQAIPQAASGFRMTAIEKHRITYAQGSGPARLGDSEPYTCPELRTTVRPGAADHEAHPSRAMNRLSYRDGSTGSRAVLSVSRHSVQAHRVDCSRDAQGGLHVAVGHAPAYGRKRPARHRHPLPAVRAADHQTKGRAAIKNAASTARTRAPGWKKPTPWAAPWP